MKPKYTIYAYSQYALNECEGDVRWITGWSAEHEAENLKDAKRRAKHLLSEEYRISGEMGERLVYAQVEDKGGDCVFDLWSGTEVMPYSDADLRCHE